MKLYRQRPVAMTVQGDKQREEDCFNPIVAVMKNSIILANPESTLQHLDPEKAEDIRCLLRKFQEVFQDVPQRCVVASHDVVLLKDSTPIKQAPYRVNPTKREIIRQEVKFLIDHGLAEPSSIERFEVQVDASDARAGAVLLQEADGEEKILHPVCYMSHKFKSHQRSYSTVEKQLLALEKWDVYLGQAKPILVYSDHSPL
ncbi:hypothetical protein Pmani_012800 [Petrolisthes manimaculis]|uniref:Reverse transcriptase RNase H-like domain-containing protein n=1 Tax=Petrolisthes manimaculis TaxID=1843537 RepID=A0AAE1PYD6_9EUCA|nr:hypothetical protein Pmani_012800 [Petrolisthes manimaculis]